MNQQLAEIRSRLRVSYSSKIEQGRVRPKTKEQIEAYISYLEDTVKQRNEERSLLRRELMLKEDKLQMLTDRTHTLMDYIKAIDLDIV